MQYEGGFSEEVFNVKENCTTHIELKLNRNVLVNDKHQGEKAKFYIRWLISSSENLRWFEIGETEILNNLHKAKLYGKKPKSRGLMHLGFRFRNSYEDELENFLSELAWEHRKTLNSLSLVGSPHLIKVH